jgi:hypothetical protein
LLGYFITWYHSRPVADDADTTTDDTSQ